jgi:hypothetical protein
MKYLYFALIFCIISSCDKPNSTPETSDEIYQDLLQELEVATKGIESEEKNLEKLLKEKDAALPQTGQVKFAQKKVFETENTLTKLKQQKQFFEVSLELRKLAVRDRYSESRRPGGRKWPDLEEIKTYKSTIKLQREKLRWDKSKGIKKDVPRGTGKSEEKNETKPTH